MKPNQSRLAAVVSMLGIAASAGAQITDFTTWTVVEDPPHPAFSASAVSTQATLSAGVGPVPQATDIGYQSIDGVDAGSSTSGHVFDASSSFMIAVDYDLSFAGPVAGSLSLGFGVGEDGAGSNSVGVVAVSFNGSAFGPYGGAARVNDTDQGALVLPQNAALRGSLFVEYDAGIDRITLGAATTPGAGAPTATNFYDGLQALWNGDDLLASFFIRSGPLGAWQGQSADAVFSNFRVISGTPIEIAPCIPDLTTQGAAMGEPGFGVPDGLVTTADIQFYVNLFVAMDLGADLTTQGAAMGDPGFGVPDGAVTTADIQFYVNAFVAGCP